MSEPNPSLPLSGDVTMNEMQTAIVRRVRDRSTSTSPVRRQVNADFARRLIDQLERIAGWDSSLPEHGDRIRDAVTVLTVAHVLATTVERCQCDTCESTRAHYVSRSDAVVGMAQGLVSILDASTLNNLDQELFGGEPDTIGRIVNEMLDEGVDVNSHPTTDTDHSRNINDV